MKTLLLRIFLAGLILPGITQCYKPGKIKVQNKIDRVELLEVRWGEHDITNSLLPGEISDTRKIKKYEERLPSSHPVHFKMQAQQKVVFLTTQESYFLDEDGFVTIELTDSTAVINVNN